VNKERILEEAVTFVKSELGADSSGHDFWHAYRVSELAGRIARAESADEFVCRLTGLIHDVADEKLNDSEESGLMKVRSWLERQQVEFGIIETMMEIIQTMSFKGGGQPPVRTMEGKIVQDADRLDAIGAIGIARTFAYSGKAGQLIYDPNLKPREEINKESYRKGKSTAVNHFYEKLLKLKDMMNTPSAQALAEERHQFMLTYLERFYQEWELK